MLNHEGHEDTRRKALGAGPSWYFVVNRFLKLNHYGFCPKSQRAHLFAIIVNRVKTASPSPASKRRVRCKSPTQGEMFE